MGQALSCQHCEKDVSECSSPRRKQVQAECGRRSKMGSSDGRHEIE